MLATLSQRAWLLRFKPVRPSLSARERVCSFAGALLGLLITGFVCRVWLGSAESVPLLIAPIGASTVLVFGVPASPLAQPWSVIGGNVLAALIGVTAAHLFASPLVAGAVAVAATILVTGWAGCLHPPAGAVALTAVIGGPLVSAAGYRFALVPVAVDSALLVAVGLAFNNLAGRTYPHVAVVPVSAHRTHDAPPEFRLGFSPKDIDAALARLGTPLDVERDDLLALFRHVEEAAHERLRGVIVCADIMSRDLVTVTEDDAVDLALFRLREHGLRVLPVLDGQGRVKAAVDLGTLATTAAAKVGFLPSVHFETVAETTPLDELVAKLSRGHVHEAMVVDGAQRLTGVVTQTDVLAVFGRAQLARSAWSHERLRSLAARARQERPS